MAWQTLKPKNKIKKSSAMFLVAEKISVFDGDSMHWDVFYVWRLWFISNNNNSTNGGEKILSSQSSRKIISFLSFFRSHFSSNFHVYLFAVAPTLSLLVLSTIRGVSFSIIYAFNHIKRRQTMINRLVFILFCTPLKWHYGIQMQRR